MKGASRTSTKPRVRASQGRGRCPCCANLRLSRALLLSSTVMAPSAGSVRALKVVSSGFDVYNIRATTITCWHNTHANLDPINSPTQFELRGDAPFKRYAPAFFFIACLCPSSLTPSSPRRSWSTV